MPIEIKELHIRVAVNTSQSGQNSGDQKSNASQGDTGGDDTKKAMVFECVEQVLQILQSKAER